MVRFQKARHTFTEAWLRERFTTRLLSSLSNSSRSGTPSGERWFAARLRCRSPVMVAREKGT